MPNMSFFAVHARVELVDTKRKFYGLPLEIFKSRHTLELILYAQRLTIRE